MDPEDEESRWYDGLFEIVCAVAIFVVLIILHSGK